MLQALSLQTAKIIGYGGKDSDKFSTKSSNESNKMPEIVPNLFENLTTLVSHRNFAAALDENGNIFYVGQKSTFNP